MTKYSMWKDLEKAFIEMHCAESIPQDSMICKKTSLKQVDTTIHQDIFTVVMINKRILIPSTHTFKNIHFEITRPSKRKIKFDVCVLSDGDQGECSSCVIFRVCAL